MQAHAFIFQSVLLHRLGGGQGWQIIGIKHDKSRELIATLQPVVEEWLAKRWADIAALNLAGQPFARMD